MAKNYLCSLSTLSYMAVGISFFNVSKVIVEAEYYTMTDHPDDIVEFFL